MPACAPGFRAMASAAEATALPCPSPHRPGGDAHGDVGGWQMQVGRSPAWRLRKDRAGEEHKRNRQENHFACHSSVLLGWIVREEVVPYPPWGTAGSRSEQMMPSMFVRHRRSDIDHREQCENKSLQKCDKDVQPHENYRDTNRYQREEHQRHHIAGKHVGIETDGE